MFWLGDLTKNGIEKWKTYTDTRTGKRTYPPKPIEGQSKAEALAAFLEAGAKHIEIGEDSRYKVAVGGVDLMFDDETAATLPPAGSLVLVKIEKFYSPSNRKDFYRLVGLGDAAMAQAMLGVLVNNQREAARVALELAIHE